MLKVLSLDEAKKLIEEKFGIYKARGEAITVNRALGRVLYENVRAEEAVPGFARSTVDGYAIKAADSFGCSASLPSIFEYRGEILMGEAALKGLGGGDCYKISTGGMLPAGADAVIMVEHAQDLDDGFIYAEKAVAPGENVVQKGDDVEPGDVFLKRGSKIGPKEMGALAATGLEKIKVFKKVQVGILSTGDELIEPSKKPETGQVRDVNSRLLQAAVTAVGAEALPLGIIKDERNSIKQALVSGLEKSDLLLISGGSSAGEKDMTVDIIAQLGEVYMHGLALKPGKPTIIGCVDGKPVVGLPGHPVAAFFVFKELLEDLLALMTSSKLKKATRPARLSMNYPSNHGREEIVPVKFKEDSDRVEPLFVKSGLITLLTGADGYIKIPRDSEGLKKDSQVEVFLF